MTKKRSLFGKKDVVKSQNYQGYTYLDHLTQLMRKIDNSYLENDPHRMHRLLFSLYKRVRSLMDYEEKKQGDGFRKELEAKESSYKNNLFIANKMMGVNKKKPETFAYFKVLHDFDYWLFEMIHKYQLDIRMADGTDDAASMM